MCLNTTPIMLCLWFPMWRCVIPDIYHAVQGNGCGWYLMGSCERDSLGLSLGAELHRWCSMRRCWRNSPESDTGLVWQFVASERRWWILILLFFLRACLLACSARMCGSLLRANEDDVIYASSCLLACLFAFIEVGRVHVCVHVRVMWVWLYTPPPAVAGTHMMAGLLLPATWIWWWWQTGRWWSVIQPLSLQCDSALSKHACARTCVLCVRVRVCCIVCVWHVAVDAGASSAAAVGVKAVVPGCLPCLPTPCLPPTHRMEEEEKKNEEQEEEWLLFFFCYK